MALAAWIGAATFRLWVLPSHLPVHERRRTDTSMARLIGASLLCLGATSVLLLTLRVATMMSEPVLSAFAMAPQVIFHTHYGPVWAIRPIALSALFVAWMAARRGTGARWPWLVMLAAGALFALSRSASGHAADAGDFTLQEAADWLHLVAISTWVGGVFVALWAVFPVLPQWVEAASPDAAAFAQRFSNTSALAMAVVLLTGLYGAFMRLPDIASLIDTDYGLTLSVKLALVAATIAAGALNRNVYVKRLTASSAAPAHEHAGNGAPGSTAASAPPPGWRSSTYFARNVAVEAGLMLATLIVVGSLLQEVPPSHMHAGHTHPAAHAQ